MSKSSRNKRTKQRETKEKKKLYFKWLKHSLKWVILSLASAVLGWIVCAFLTPQFATNLRYWHNPLELSSNHLERLAFSPFSIFISNRTNKPIYDVQIEVLYSYLDGEPSFELRWPEDSSLPVFVGDEYGNGIVWDMSAIVLGFKTDQGNYGSLIKLDSIAPNENRRLDIVFNSGVSFKTVADLEIQTWSYTQN